jgi:two-component system copper resistance phosphate regulon response regulator CusR
MEQENTEKKRILVVEDEKRLADVIKAGLEEQGYLADVAYDGYIGKMMVQRAHYDLLILDVNLPMINGYELCKEIRAQNLAVPVIMLTAMACAENKLAGFDAGTDDYLVKPFDFNELLARVKVFLRRTSLPEKGQDSVIHIADLQINTTRKIAKRGEKMINLTSKEYILLEYLARKRGVVVSRTEIAENIWGIHFDTGTNYIDVYINYLRNKIDRNFPEKLIHTRIGFGYMLESLNE